MVFRIPKEVNYEADIVAKLVSSRMAKMQKGELVEKMETLYIERIRFV